MKNKILFYSILIILFIGIMGAGGLVLEEFKTGKGCPKILHIPMCLVILICFIIPLIIHLLNKFNFIYFIFTGIAGSIALLASSMQFLGYSECPKTANGTPMCYYSLLLFSTLVILKSIKNTLKKS